MKSASLIGISIVIVFTVVFGLSLTLFEFDFKQKSPVFRYAKSGTKNNYIHLAGSSNSDENTDDNNINNNYEYISDTNSATKIKNVSKDSNEENDNYQETEEMNSYSENSSDTTDNNVDKFDSEDTSKNVSSVMNEYESRFKDINSILYSSSTINYNVHAFYYPWYGSYEHDGKWRHWDHEMIPHWRPEIRKQYPPYKHQPPEDIGANFYPLLGPYSSRDLNIIREHMKYSAMAGIGVLSVSWYPHDKSDDNFEPVDNYIRPIMTIALEYKIKITFHIEPYKERSAASVKKDIQYIITNYGKHPSFYLYKNKPLLYIYDSYHISSSEWSTILMPEGSNTIRYTPYDAIVVGLAVESRDCQELVHGGFNGIYTYFATNGFTYGSTYSNWMALKECSSHLQAPALFIPSVGPGYMDVAVRPWNGENTRDRQNGDYYKNSWNNALSSKASIVSITSFNEWHEGTQIEPAIIKKDYSDYGPNPFLYLKLTKEFAIKFHA